MTIAAVAAQVVNGLVLGSLYVMITLGLSLAFGMIGVVNFAHGVMFTLGVYVSFTVGNAFGFWAGLLVAPLVVGVLAMGLERVMLRPLYGKLPLYGLLATFGVALVVEELIRVVWGSLGMGYGAPDYLSGDVPLGFMRFSRYRLFTLVASAALVCGLWLFLMKTRVGLMIRAGSRDPEMVSMLGIPIPRVLTFVFGVAGATAAVAGVLASPMWGILPTIGMTALMPAFVVVVLGGLGTFWGVVFAGLLVGLVQSLMVLFFPPASEAAMFLVMILTLLVRPRGLMGEIWETFE